MEPVVLYCITWSYRSRIQEELSGLFCSLWFLTKATSVFSSRWAGLEGIGWLHSHIWNVGGNDFKIESGQGRRGRCLYVPVSTAASGASERLCSDSGLPKGADPAPAHSIVLAVGYWSKHSQRSYTWGCPGSTSSWEKNQGVCRIFNLPHLPFKKLENLLKDNNHKKFAWSVWIVL